MRVCRPTRFQDNSSNIWDISVTAKNVTHPVAREEKSKDHQHCQDSLCGDYECLHQILCQAIKHI